MWSADSLILDPEKPGLENLQMGNSKRKIKSLQELRAILGAARSQGERIVFTNGCFDLIHPGHIRFLEKARSLGDLLVVALNSDTSVRRIKGRNRPVLSQHERAEIMSALGCVDFVTTFEEKTPQRVIQELIPDVLAKGKDWSPERIIGRDVVESNGGEVVLIDFEEGFSSSEIIGRIRQ